MTVSGIVMHTTVIIGAIYSYGYKQGGLHMSAKDFSNVLAQNISKVP